MDKKTAPQNVWVDIRKKDTSPEVNELQRKIWLSKSEEERFKMTLEMMDMVRLAAESAVRNDNPSISAFDLKIETFKRMYRHDYTREKLEEIISWMKNVQSGKAKGCSHTLLFIIV